MKVTIEFTIDSKDSREFIESLKINGVNIDFSNFNTSNCSYFGALLIDYYNNLYWETPEQKKLLEENNNRKPEKELKIENGYVYLMFDSSLNLYKIGYSKKPKFREKTLQGEKPTIDLILYFNESLKTERILHEKFSDKRTRGEWFKLDQKDVNWIESNFAIIKP